MGSGHTVYAFLVVTETPGDYVSAASLGYNLATNGTVVNAGFTVSGGWQRAAGNYYGYDPPPGLPGQQVPAAIGYWTLHLPAGPASSGTFSLVAPGGVNGSAIVVVDADRRALAVTEARHGGINTAPPAPTTQPATHEFLVAPSHHVLTMYRLENVVFPSGVIGAPLESFVGMDPTLRGVLDDYAPLRIDRVFPSIDSGDSVRIGMDGTSRRLPALWRIVKVTCEDSTAVDPLMLDLGGLESITYAEANAVLSPTVEPNDDAFQNGEQWHLNNYGQDGGTADADIDAPEAWDVTTGSTGTTVCILDTGIDASHDDFVGRTIIGDSGFGGDQSPYHGTHVAGIVGAATNNDLGVAGIDWQCRLMNQWTTLTNEDVANSIIEARDTGADVINMSFGGPNPSETMRHAAHTAFLSDVLLVAAMGNENSDNPSYPARYSEIITAVGGTTRNDSRALFSNYGNWMDVCAPGLDITSTLLNDQYGALSGTSMAAPMVSGVASLLLALDPSLRDVDAEEIMERSAEDRGDTGFDNYFGWGRLNARDALDYVREQSVFQVLVNEGEVYEQSHTGWYNVTWYNPPDGHPNGVYQVRRYEMRADVAYPKGFASTPDVWMRLGPTEGYSAANPHYYDFHWGSVVSTNTTGCTLKTFVYEVAGIGWWPVPPDQCRMAYTVAGQLPAAEVDTNASAVGDGTTLELLGAQPCPVGDPVRFVFRSPVAQTIDLGVFDSAGRQVRRLSRGTLAPGSMVRVWDGRNDRGLQLPAGIYYLRAAAGGVATSKRVILVR